MKISARNNLSGIITEIKLGEITAEITVQLNAGTLITASITRSSAERLGLTVGQAAYTIIKASDVMIGVEE